MYHARERWEIYTKFSLENLKGRDHSEDPGVRGKIILEWVKENRLGNMRSGRTWLRIRTNGGLL
jgi:hypothetical protein